MLAICSASHTTFEIQNYDPYAVFTADITANADVDFGTVIDHTNGLVTTMSFLMYMYVTCCANILCDTVANIISSECYL